MAKLIALEVKVSFPSESMCEQAAKNTMSNRKLSSDSCVNYRMSLCNAIPREITGVISVTSDILVSMQEVSDSVYTVISINLLAHLFIHKPKSKCLVPDQSLIVALGIGNTLLSPAAILKSPADIRHVPILILELLYDLDPHIGNGHCQTIVEPHSTVLCRDAQQWHTRYILGNCDNTLPFWGIGIKLTKHGVREHKINDALVVYTRTVVLVVSSGETGTDAVVVVHHAGDTVETESVEMIFLDPPSQVTQQEAKYLVISVVEQTRVP
jgi:hypothetical protein